MMKGGIGIIVLLFCVFAEAFSQPDSCVTKVGTARIERICEGDTFFQGTSQYVNSGIYYDTLATTAGCDSIVVLNLQVLPIIFGPFPVTICTGDSFVFGSSVYQTS